MTSTNASQIASRCTTFGQEVRGEAPGGCGAVLVLVASMAESPGKYDSASRSGRRGLHRFGCHDNPRLSPTHQPPDADKRSDRDASNDEEDPLVLFRLGDDD